MTSSCDFLEQERIEELARAAAAAAGLKPEQLQAIVEFARSHVIFVSLPTGFGKSSIYGLLPVVIERMQKRPDRSSVTIVISPLSSLMFDQCAHFTPRGISAEFLGKLKQDERQWNG